METNAAFVSYSRKDSAFVERLVRDLKAAGANIWLDKFDIRPGAEWDRAVEESLMSCLRMLLILSPTSAASPNVLDEISVAMRSGKTILPILYQDCAIPMRVCRLQYIDFRTDYDQGFQILLQQLKAEQTASENTPPNACDNKRAQEPIAEEPPKIAPAVIQAAPLADSVATHSEPQKKIWVFVAAGGAVLIILIWIVVHFSSNKSAQELVNSPSQTTPVGTQVQPSTDTQTQPNTNAESAPVAPAAKSGSHRTTLQQKSSVDLRLRDLLGQSDVAATFYLSSPTDMRRDGNLVYWNYRQRSLLLVIDTATGHNTVSRICFEQPGFAQFSGSSGDPVEGISPGMTKSAIETKLGAPSKVESGGIYSIYDQVVPGYSLRMGWLNENDGAVAGTICLDK